MKFFKKWIYLNIILLVFYFLFRIIFLGLLDIFSLSIFNNSINNLNLWAEIFKAFFVGLRFDLMVIGFLNLPWMFFLNSKFVQSLYPYIIRIYLFLSSVVVYLDHCLYISTGDRWSLNHFLLDKTNEVDFLNFFQLIIISCLFLIVDYLTRLYSKNTNEFQNPAVLKQISFDKIIGQDSKQKNFRVLKYVDPYLILMLLITILMARGSLGAHHLDLRHAQFSKNPQLNILSINSLYALDQAIRSRR